MEMVTNVDKAELLKVIRENRDKHHEVFLASLEGDRVAALARLEEQVTDLKAGRTPKISIYLSRPEDHTRDYDRVIGMLVMDEGTKYSLDERHYAQYVDDDWQWKRDWLKMSSQYASGSTISNYGSAAVEDDD